MIDERAPLARPFVVLLNSKSSLGARMVKLQHLEGFGMRFFDWVCV